MHSHSARGFLPAAGHDWFLPLYDPFTKLLGIAKAHRALIAQASLGSNDRVLEVGCGTGNLVLLLKKLRPGADVVGLDPDAKALSRARKKALRASVSIQFDEGFADAMPYEDDSFDRVLSSFMFHHLEDKTPALREIRRVLKPGGRLELLDFAGHDDRIPFKWLHAHQQLHDNSEAHVLGFLREAGFADPKKLSEHSLLLGRSAYYQAPK
ncbi:MAG TPA: methyltransferase domain-containing protein [Polyangiaceae bacterium]|jgi:ubiquinone/menaquinone biosynthesis C-methylase UbiE|nr:methyltransferase domain-containing protein [Polyangiaceae bacterium]